METNQVKKAQDTIRWQEKALRIEENASRLWVSKSGLATLRDPETTVTRSIENCAK